MAKKVNSKKTYKETIETNGLQYEFQIVHMLNSMDTLVQIIDNNTGTNLTDNYTFIRDGLNTSTLRFNRPPIAREKYTILLIKVD